jgi:putative Holliday junction resolvase
MGRILAIDFGKKRTGIAVSDPLRIIASPLETVLTKDLEKYLTEYLTKETVDEIVVGYPVTLNNKPSEAVKYIDPFVRRLKKLFPGHKVNLVDERFTSSMAKKALIEGGVKKSDRQDKSLADKISAALILRSFMERKQFEANNKINK